MFCDINPGTGKQTEEELQKQYSSDSVSFIKADVADSQQLKGTHTERYSLVVFMKCYSV